MDLNGEKICSNITCSSLEEPIACPKKKCATVTHTHIIKMVIFCAFVWPVYISVCRNNVVFKDKCTCSTDTIINLWVTDFIVWHINLRLTDVTVWHGNLRVMDVTVWHSNLQLTDCTATYG